MMFYTYTGKMLDLKNPTQSEICNEDIAHALSRLCRAGGHFRHFYSVAQHSINCMEEAKKRGCSERVCRAALLHDASEAYLCDIPSPLKCELEDYRSIEKRFETVIWQKYGLYPLSDEEKQIVKQIDEDILWYEFKTIHTIPIDFCKIPKLESVPDTDEKNMCDVEKAFWEKLEMLADGESVA